MFITFSSGAIDKIFGLSNGAEMFLANVTFNQTFNPSPAKSAEFDVIPMVLSQASDKVQLLL